MKVINTEALINFSITYPDASISLDTWLKIAKESQWRHLMDVKTTYSKATDFVEGKTVFNIKGNKYRLITKINYRVGVIRVYCVLTHEEYNLGKWKDL